MPRDSSASTRPPPHDRLRVKSCFEVRPRYTFRPARRRSRHRYWAPTAITRDRRGRAAVSRRDSSPREASSTGRGPNVLREMARLQARRRDQKCLTDPAPRRARPACQPDHRPPGARAGKPSPPSQLGGKALQPNHQRVSRKRPARATHAHRNAAGPRSLIARHRTLQSTSNGPGEAPKYRSLGVPLRAARATLRRPSLSCDSVSRAYRASGAGGGRRSVLTRRSASRRL